MQSATEAIAAAATAIRVLTVDAVHEAGIGHVGLPLGCAEIGSVLFSEFLKHDPAEPTWFDRDRFVLSAGHGSMLLYSLLHLSGYKVSLSDLKEFRQLGSITPGHPEHGMTPGVETTTGPLGQGIANAVGMALAERLLAQRFGEQLVNHRTYALASDGDLMEGVASEAASLAGHLKLGKLVVIYDDNGITIDGKTDLSFSEEVGKRFEAYGWGVQRIDGHDIQQIRLALTQAGATEERPQLIIARTQIGFGSPAVGTSTAHGHLATEAVQATRTALKWASEPFVLLEHAYEAFRRVRARGHDAHAAWRERKTRALEDGELNALWQAMIERKLPGNLDALFPDFTKEKPQATRQASGLILNALAAHVPSLIGGSADLAGSNGTHLKGHSVVSGGDFSGRNLAFGVREHAMGAIANGLVLHGGIRPYVATFLVFSDYMRPPIRLAALMDQPVTFVFTHDSIFVGEDGPTHQPVEHVAALRTIPNLQVWRPADPRETVAAWRSALLRTGGPTALALTRQTVPTIDLPGVEEKARRGGYVVVESDGTPELVIVATGSEVGLAVDAARALQKEGRKVRAVSLPCVEVFFEQDEAYQREVLGEARRLVVEAGVQQGLGSVIRPGDRFHGMRGFGASASYKKLAERFGFTSANIELLARELLG
ncbi:MAG: transketolase [Myxococcaceae bacterium]|nr:transketolase [Myxococcaceae bacterium]